MEAARWENGPTFGNGSLNGECPEDSPPQLPLSTPPRQLQPVTAVTGCHRPSPAVTGLDDGEFNWSTDESVIINEQPATAVYWNKQDQLVIRQQVPYPDEDVYVVFNQENLRHLIEMIEMRLGR
jgi:hypothetical protein